MEDEAMVNEGLRRAILFFGSQDKLAAAIGVTQQCVSRWHRGINDVPICQAIRIEKASDGAINRSDLRPDLYR